MLLVALVQSACHPPHSSSRLTVASAGKISSLDPAKAGGGSTVQLLSALGDPLYKLDASGNLEPRLAAAPPDISADGLSITIPLRRDVLFHDGTRFDAEAMAFSLRRFLRIGTLSYIVGGRIDAVEVIAPYTLRLKLTRASISLKGCSHR